MISLDTKTIQEQQNWRQKHPTLWRIVLGLLIAATTIIALFCALFILLNTQSGKNYVLNQIQKRSHDQVQIQGISSFFSSQLSIEDVKFKDPNGGVWLDAKQVQLNWSPWESFRNSKIIIYSLVVKEVNLYSFPSKRAIIDLSKEKQQPVNLAYVVDIQNIQIKRLFISKNISPLEMYITINGKVLIRDLSKMIDTETLKTVLMTKPKLHLLDSKKLPDFQFNGRVSGNLTGKEGSSASIPLHFSVMLPQELPKNTNDKAEIYLDLGGDN